jgi:hypothetical protein
MIPPGLPAAFHHPRPARFSAAVQRLTSTLVMKTVIQDRPLPP